jgi:hypothetical protein
MSRQFKNVHSSHSIFPCQSLGGVLQKAKMVSVKEFTAQYDRRNREQSVLANMRAFKLSREDAELMYTRDMKDIVEAAVVNGEVDPDSK